MACTPDTGRRRPAGGVFASMPFSQRIVGGLEAARRLPYHSRQVLSRAVTEYIQRGAIARSVGDKSVRAGQTRVRPTAILDMEISPQVDAARLFGDAVTAARSEGARWDRLVDTRGRVMKGRAGRALAQAATAAATEARDAGLLASDTPVDGFGAAVEALVKATGGEAPASAQAVVELGVAAAQAARNNLGKAQLADWAKQFHGATETKRSTTATIDLKVDGKTRHVRVDPWIAAVTKEASGDTVAGVLGLAARLARTGQLTLNVGWQVANFPIDIHRSLGNVPNYGFVAGLPKAIGDALAAFGVSRWASLSPLQREMLLARDDVSPAAKRQIAELQEMEEAGALPSEWRPDIIEGAGAQRTGRVPDIGKLLGDDYQTGLRGWADLMLRMATSPLATIGEGMRVMEANPKVAAYRRMKKDRGGKPPTTGQKLTIREGVGSPPFGETYRGTNPWLGSLFHYFSSTVNGIIADGRVLTNPRTAPAAAGKLALTVIAPAIIQAAARSNAFGGEDDDTWWGAYVRGLQALPTWRLGIGVHLPFALDREAPGGPRFVMVSLPINRTFLPLSAAITAGWSQAEAGATAGDVAAEAGKAFAGGLFPSQAVGLDVLSDTYDFLRGQNPRDEFRERDVFTRGEWEGASRVDKSAKFFLYHVPQQFGFRATGIAMMRAYGKPELAGVRARANEQGLQVDEVPIGGALLRRFVSVDATMGRRERDRLQVDVENRAKSRERQARYDATNRAVRMFVDAHPEFRPRSILADSRRFVKGLGLRGAERTRALTSFRRSAFLAYPEGRRFSSWVFPSFEAYDSMAKGRNRGERSALLDWVRQARSVRAITEDRASAIRRAVRRARR